MPADKPTISEVAKIAMVSKTTVSRYLNDRFEFMSEATRKRIHQVIDELNYHPNNLARSLKSNRSGLIGVLVADISSPFSSILVKGIGDDCKEHGYQTIIVNTDNDPEKERQYIQSLLNNRVEGLIMNITGQNLPYLLELKAEGVPIVLADRPMQRLEFDTITTNNYQMTYDAMLHLHKQGFKRIGFFTQKIDGISTRTIRREAFLKACEDLYGVDGREWLHVVEPSDIKSIAQGIKSFLSNHGPSAVFSVNGVTLLGVVQAVTELGLNIPSDIGLCGYDDWGWAAVIPPGITVISQPSYRVGVEASKRLRLQIDSERKVRPKVMEIPSTLIIRGSTKLHRD